MTVAQRKSSSKSVVPVSDAEIIDYSFREITSEKLPELATKYEARSKLKPKSDEKVAAKAVKINNNLLGDLNGLYVAFAAIIHQPENITWIDLSFNNVQKIPPCFADFLNLKMLYLHGNDIQDCKHLNILSKFEDLISFTIHGNPVEALVPGYKWYILAHAPGLKSLNFTGLSKGDRKEAEMLRKQLNRQRQSTDEDDDA